MDVSPEARDMAGRLDRIQKLIDELAKVRDDAVEQQHLAERLRRELQQVRASLQILP
jgi:hypothetical protein